MRFGSDPCDFDSRPTHSTDSDRDGLRDSEERQEFNTDYQTFDTDDDGVQDFAEIKLGFSPRQIRTDTLTLDGERPEFLAHDRDRDAVFDEHELARGLDPLNPDQDRDGIRDGLELRRGLDPQLADQGPGWPGPWVDFDADGLSDAVEGRLGTSPLTADTDGDGVSDGNEARMGLNPNREDSDYDGLPDGREDWDGDGMSNQDEELVGLDPASTDSDGDGICDPVDMREHSEDASICAANGGCWSPPTGSCPMGACPVLAIPSCSPTGGTIYVNGEAYVIPPCAGGGDPNAVIYVPIGYNQDVVISYTCGMWPSHGAPAFGHLCRGSGYGGADIFHQDPNFTHEKEDVNDCSNPSNIDRIGGQQSATTPPPPGGPGCEGSGNQGPPRIDVHIDSDNNDGFNPPLGFGGIRATLEVLDTAHGGRVRGTVLLDIVYAGQRDAVEAWKRTGDLTHLQSYAEIAEDAMYARLFVSRLQVNHLYQKSWALYCYELKIGRTLTNPQEIADAMRALDAMPAMAMPTELHQVRKGFRPGIDAANSWHEFVDTSMRTFVKTPVSRLTAAQRAQQLLDLDTALEDAATAFNNLHGLSTMRPGRIDFLEAFRGAKQWNEEFMQ